MCGVSGFVGAGDAALLQRMTGAMLHRGPDAGGVWLDEAGGAGLGHRRLSIVDLSDTGAQPMRSADGRITLCYNGELYDYREHRRDLEADGYRFRGNSDSEVVLNLLHRDGIDCLNRMNGIFAFAAWDASQRTMTLARDQAGVKPLYWCRDGQGVLFASEVRALLASGRLSARMSQEALATFLHFLYVPGPMTLFEGVRKLEPGTVVTIRGDQIREHRWYTPPYAPDPAPDMNAWVERARPVFDDAVRRQLMADVGVGAFLSGGIDSSAIVEAARRFIDPTDLQCFTVVYPAQDVVSEGYDADLPFARLTAQHFGLKLHEVSVTPAALDRLPAIVRSVEEPDADLTALVTDMLAGAARQAGATVLLSGTGGDEVFYGYRTHLAYGHLERVPAWACAPAAAALQAARRLATLALPASTPALRRAERFAQALARPGASRHLAIVNHTGAIGAQSILAADVARQLPRDRYLEPLFERYAALMPAGADDVAVHGWLLQQSFLADHNFLYTDKCGMAHSIEIRVPFTDRELLKLSGMVPPAVHLAGGQTKHLLKRMMRGRLDDRVIDRPKVGFNPPVRTWIAGGRSDLCNELLAPETIRRRGIFDAGAIEQLALATRAGKVDGAQLLFAAQILELWCREFIDGATNTAR